MKIEVEFGGGYQVNGNQLAAIRHGIEMYGVKQLYVAIEELSELQKELCKVLRGKTNMDNIIEELGDVMIMVETVKQYFNITDTSLQETINEKLKRIS